MRSKTVLKPCPFCGADTKRTAQYYDFQCTDEKCLALVSFGGDKVVDCGTVEARNPIDNFNRRADNG